MSHENRVPDLPARQVRGSSLSTGGQNLQNLAFSGMVALGCWGMAFFFAFFYTEANRYLYGAIMAITALGWSIIVARRWSTYRQRA
ncbi:MAG TPA: hypothetical protein VFV38_29170 [Ktedonobacteraceae bacterium]|nr:hypothetical protein [Ktedonobacteraceae bacterium]